MLRLYAFFTMRGIDFLASREIVIVSGARTPFGAYLGSLSGMSATLA
jgi:hypothetical protein